MTRIQNALEPSHVAGSIVDQRRYDKRAPGSARGGACGYNLSHDQLSSVDQQYTNCDPYKARLG